MGPGKSDAAGTAGPAPAATNRPSDRIARALRRHRWGTVAGIAVGAVLLTVGAFAGAGWRWFDVQTPSMGQAAPVGTLLITEPADPAALQPGDIVTFHPPGQARVFAHRIVAIGPGGLTTKGDANGAPDGWTVPTENVIGRVAMRWWAIGWLLRGLPWLLAGGALVAVTVRLAGARRRMPIAVIGATLTVAVAASIVRPFLRAGMLGWTPTPAGGVDISAVSTGILPIRVTGEGGSSVDLEAGQVGVVHATIPDANGAYHATPGLHLTFWWWVLYVLVCLTPLVVAIAVGQPSGPPRPRTRIRTRRRPVTAAVAVAVAAGTLVAGQVTAPPAAAGFAARVANTSASAGSRQFFTCASALSGTAGSYLAWSLASTGLLNSAADISGHLRTGVYFGTVTHPTSSGCTRDGLASTQFNGSDTCVIGGDALSSAPTTFSIAVWFRTSTAPTGQLLAFSNAQTGILATNNDRKLYIDPAGRLVFGVRPGGTVRYLASPSSVADGAWHQALATLNPTTGSALYLDGQSVATDGTLTSAQSPYLGWWRAGCGTMAGWAYPGTPTWTGPSYFTGRLTFVQVYSAALTAVQARDLYLAGAP